MNNLNSIILEGNCVQDPILFTTAKGTSVCNFAIANHRSYKVGDEYTKEVSFFDIEVWGKQAEVTAKYCPKGRGIRVVGRLKQNRWEDSDGKKCSKIRIIAEHIEFKPQINQTDNIQKSQTKESVPENEEIPAF